MTLTKDFASFLGAGTQANIDVVNLPAKAKVVSVITDVTEAFAGTGISTITMTVGHTVGGNEYLVSQSLTATGQKGLADADLGTSLNRANAVQGGHIPSWSSTSNIQARFTADANFGTGAATNLTTGSITFYVIVELF